MLRATIIANLMTVEGNNAYNKLTHINAHYRKEIIQKFKIAMRSACNLTGYKLPGVGSAEPFYCC